MNKCTPFLDKLGLEDLNYRRPSYVMDRVKVEASIDSISGPSVWDSLIAKRIVITLGTEVQYMTDSDGAARGAQKIIRSMLSDQIFGNIKSLVNELDLALFEEDLYGARDILKDMRRMME